MLRQHAQRRVEAGRERGGQQVTGVRQIVVAANSAVDTEPDGRVLSRRTYELEPFLSGRYTIPPMTAVFADSSSEQVHL